MNKSTIIFLEHILENIEKIEKFSKGISEQDLSEDSQKQYALVRAIEIIGEAVKNLPIDLINKYPKVPWKDIVGTRDKLIHHYFGVDLDVVWKIIKEDIPDLKKQIQKIKADLKK